MTPGLKRHFTTCNHYETTGLDLLRDPVPDETTILNFRHLIERHALTESLFEAVKSELEERAVLLRGGTIMDATLIGASSSTKNNFSRWDPDISQAKKGNSWYFGMKLHIGVDAKSGLVHTVGTTTAKRHDAPLTEDLMRPDDRIIFGDKGYASQKRKRALRSRGVVWVIKDKALRGRGLSALQKRRNKKHGAVWAKVKHAFRVINASSATEKPRAIVHADGPEHLYLARKRLMGEPV